MIVVLLESSVTPRVQSFGDVYGLIVSKRLGADEPCTLRDIDNHQYGWKQPTAVVQPELSPEQVREMSVDWFAKGSFRPLRLREFTLLQHARKFHRPGTAGEKECVELRSTGQPRAAVPTRFVDCYTE